jgi:hypothetical protein
MLLAGRSNMVYCNMASTMTFMLCLLGALSTYPLSTASIIMV